MNFKELSQIENEIRKKIENNFDKSNKQRKPIYDGIVDINLYLNSSLKIMWVLKEPYDRENGEGGGWDLGKDLLDKKRRHKVILGKFPAIQVMTYITYGIFNNKMFEEMKKIRKDPEMSEVLTHIAWINVNKMPSVTGSKSHSLWKEYGIWKNILLEQIKYYDSNVIIFGNTFDYFKNNLLNSKITLNKKETLNYFIKENQLFIDACHPAQRSIKRKKYVDEIIETVKYFKNDII